MTIDSTVCTKCRRCIFPLSVFVVFLVNLRSPFSSFRQRTHLSPVSLSLPVQRGANVDNTIRSRERRGQIPGRIPGDWNTKEGDSAARGSSLLGSLLFGGGKRCW